MLPLLSHYSISDMIDLRTMGKLLTHREQTKVDFDQDNKATQTRLRGLWLKKTGIARQVATLSQRDLWQHKNIYNIAVAIGNFCFPSESQYHSFSISPYVRRDLCRCIDINHGWKRTTVDALWSRKKWVYIYLFAIKRDCRYRTIVLTIFLPFRTSDA